MFLQMLFVTEELDLIPCRFTVVLSFFSSC
ncbi:unnamed protein product, partial [Larinioides sclopetarius]